MLIQWIICKHKQAYISTKICEDTAKGILKKTYFLFTILGVCLPLKVLYTTQEYEKVCPNYERSYVNINKHSNIK